MTSVRISQYVFILYFSLGIS